MINRLFSSIQRTCRLSMLGSVGALAITSASHAQCDPGQVVRLFADDGTLGDHYGVSVAISGDTAVVGAIDAQQPNGVATGSAYVYERIDGVWTFHTQLSPFDLAVGDQFGQSVAIDEHVIVVGSPFDDDFGNNSGSVFVYQRFIGLWPQIAKLTASDGEEGDSFGSTVAVDGETIIVGAFGDDDHGDESGAAYIYNLVDFAWTPGVKLVPADGQSGDFYGSSVSIKGDIAAVGAVGVSDTVNQEGAVYMYSRPTGGAWAEQAKLLASDSDFGNWFGRSVALGTDAVVIGAPFDSNSSGSAYVFTTNNAGSTWAQQAKLAANDGSPFDQFGAVSISADDNTIVIGAFSDATPVGNNSGSAYVYTRAGGTWIQREKIVPEGAFEWHGVSVSIDGDTLFVGAGGDTNGPSQTGSAYVYGINCPPSLADLNGDGELNFFDVSVFLSAYTLNDPIADFNKDGQWNFFDVSAFLAAFAAGSP